MKKKNKWIIIFGILILLISSFLIAQKPLYTLQSIDEMDITPSKDSFFVPSSPPEGIYDNVHSPSLNLVKNEKILPVVPIIWTDGCVGTSLGMILYYYEHLGVTKTNTISSRDHFSNYSNPMDSCGDLKPDRSIKGQDTHPNECLGDFLQTSRYAEGLFYGASYKHMTLVGLDKYLKSVGFENARYQNVRYGPVIEDIIKMEIDNGRPMMAAVDISGNGVEEHAVVCNGYSYDESGKMYLVICDTWKLDYTYIELNPVGVPWGLSDVYIIGLGTTPNPIPVHTAPAILLFLLIILYKKREKK
jgi:hypothetical protein